MPKQDYHRWSINPKQKFGPDPDLIEKAKADFLARGGTITKLPYMGEIKFLSWSNLNDYFGIFGEPELEEVCKKNR